ncbi:hypothetical protein CHARACLAT_011296 [Characodon lateralis]|uniref:Uncharacterized protein n=1 Tax=Characodon lateralis TaxID=208331 RepID=A0ABU7EVL0_9TELE|nr:hypothetical protein [Characodon lateralis]
MHSRNVFLIFYLLFCFSGSKDKVAIQTTSFPRLSASDDPSSPTFPSSNSGWSPSSSKAFAPDEPSAGDYRVPGFPSAGQEHGRQANRSRGQQLPTHNHKRATSPRKTSQSDSKSGSPRGATEGQTDHMVRSQSPQKTLEDTSKEREAHGRKNKRSTSPRKASKREQDPVLPSGNPEERQSPRRPAGQQPAGEVKDWRHRGEDASYQQERGAADSGDKSRGTGERHRKGKRADKEASAQKPHQERAGSDTDPATASHRSGRERAEKEYPEAKYQGPAEHVNRRDPRGSSSSIQDPNCNGTSTSKKAPITPGPWKVPSSAKIQSHVDSTYADF